MDDREADLRIFHPGSGISRSRDYEQPSPDLLPPVHARRIFLPYEAAFRETYAIELYRIAFEPKHITKLGSPFADAEPEAVSAPT